MNKTTFKNNNKSNQNKGISALYIHVPFCLKKCRYCDFYSVPISEKIEQAFIEATKSELKMHSEFLDAPLNSIFIGGGTPTCLQDNYLQGLLLGLRKLASDQTEFTIEANPGTIDAAKAHLLAGHGVNRISLGAQSFNPDELDMLGRIHTPEKTIEAVKILKDANITNISLDLIYGLPGQNLLSWQGSLEKALGLEIEHLSCYCLSIEPQTQLFKELQAGTKTEMNELLQRECYYRAIEMAQKAGLEHYEISNFAKVSKQSRHNLTYWKNEPYLGIGPAAASFFRGVRRSNFPDLNAYIDSLEKGRQPPCESEKLTGRNAMAETIMLALRMIDGLDRASFTRRFGQDVISFFPKSIQRYADQDALSITPDRISLSKKALFAADTILADIIAEA